MVSRQVQVLLAAVAVAYATYKLINGQPTVFIFLIAFALLVVCYLRYGAIRPAFFAMQRGDLRTARKLMETIKYPELLCPQSSAYYHWIKAVLEIEKSGNTDYAVEQLQIAIDGQLRTSTDRCIATALLAHIFAEGGDMQRALQTLEAAEHIPHRVYVDTYLQQIRAELKQGSIWPHFIGELRGR